MRSESQIYVGGSRGAKLDFGHYKGLPPQKAGSSGDVGGNKQMWSTRAHTDRKIALSSGIEGTGRKRNSEKRYTGPVKNAKNPLIRRKKNGAG